MARGRYDGRGWDWEPEKPKRRGSVLPLLILVLLVLLGARGWQMRRQWVEEGTADLFPGLTVPSVRIHGVTFPSFAIPRISFGTPRLPAAALPEAASDPPADGLRIDGPPTDSLGTVPAGGGLPAQEEALSALRQEGGGSAALRDDLHAQVWDGAREISFRPAAYGGLSDQEVEDAMSALYFLPDMFALTGFSGEKTTWNGSDVSYSIRPTYREDIYAVYDEAKALVSRELGAISSGVDPGWSDLEKVLWLHDYVVTHYAYDTTYTNYDLYSMLRDGRGVCQAYTLLMTALLDRMGIGCSYVTSESLDHRWNIVELDGIWYHMDVTWDDPTPDGLGSAAHTYFLVSTARMEEVEDGRHFRRDDWIYGVDADCTDTRYERGPWRDAVSPFVQVRGEWCYVDGRSLRYWDGRESHSVASFQTLCQRLWPGYVWDADREYTARSGLFLYDGRLWFDIWWGILSYDPYTGALGLALDDFDGPGLTGCAERDGLLAYSRYGDGSVHTMAFPA